MEKLIKPDIRIENVWDVEQEKHFRKITSLVRIPGLKLYQFNLVNFELKEVEVVKTTMVNFKKKKVVNDQAIHDENCFYIQALNLKNAEKKATRVLTKFIIFLEGHQAKK